MEEEEESLHLSQSNNRRVYSSSLLLQNVANNRWHLRTVYVRDIKPVMSFYSAQDKFVTKILTDRAHSHLYLKNLPLPCLGLFTQKMEQNEQIIKHFGEKISPKESDRGEQEYVKAGKENFYLYKLNQNIIIDASCICILLICKLPLPTKRKSNSLQ